MYKRQAVAIAIVVVVVVVVVVVEMCRDVTRRTRNTKPIRRFARATAVSTAVTVNGDVMLFVW